jgi:hypothetical protein
VVSGKLSLIFCLSQPDRCASGKPQARTKNKGQRTRDYLLLTLGVGSVAELTPYCMGRRSHSLRSVAAAGRVGGVGGVLKPLGVANQNGNDTTTNN